MALQFHPLAFGLMLVVAVGTVAYSVWNGMQSGPSHTYDRPPRYDQPPCYDEASWINPNGDNERKKNRDRKYDTCSICLDKLKGRVKNLVCGHMFHTNCIDKWIMNNDSCPNCRKTCL